MEIDADGDLKRVAEARAAIADRLVTPWWYVSAFGVLLALPPLGLGIGLPQGLSLVLVGLGGSLMLTFFNTNRCGVSYTGSVRGPHDRWLRTLLATLVVLNVAALVIGFWNAGPLLIWIPPALVLLLTIGLGQGYERTLSTTLRASE